MSTLPVIDLFAGCGGFSEGFARYSSGHNRFEIVAAVDNNVHANTTHTLRQVFHQFEVVPEEYYELLRGKLTLNEFYSLFEEQHEKASSIVRTLTLGEEEDNRVLKRSFEKSINSNPYWVLIGGPPCQAYSMVGRSVRKANASYNADTDNRHILYKEYLRVIANHWPAVFVMENVPGVFSAKFKGREVWNDIISDLTDPAAACGLESHELRYDGYRLYSLVVKDRGVDIFGITTLKEAEFLVNCEDYGIPQARRRVVIVGVRDDLDAEPGLLSRHKDPVTVREAFEGLPRIRSALSRVKNDDSNWRALLESVRSSSWFSEQKYSDVSAALEKHLKKGINPDHGSGSEFVSAGRDVQTESDFHEWIQDPLIQGFCNFSSKAHLESDILRYFFLSSHRETNPDQISNLDLLPDELLPDHKNVDRKILEDKTGQLRKFADRFFVQGYDQPARTVVSHIAKDGHGFIHPDPAQARTLTPREAARLQSFPDNFFFPVPKTAQYEQIGNAVPPLLAYQIAEIVFKIIEDSKS